MGAPAVRVALTLLVFVSMLAVFGTTAAAKPTDKPDKEKVAICHYSADEATWELLLIGPKAAEQRLALGDGLPSQLVPGTDGEYVFDEYCVPQPVTPPETIFAVAYGDVDTADGDYNPAVDLMIAKFVDGEGTAADGLPGVGDKLITNQYPTSFATTGFGTFNLTEHTITNVFSATSSAMALQEGDQAWFRFYNGEYGNHEFYHEYFVYMGPEDSMWVDGIASELEDKIEFVTGSPSQPQTSLSTITQPQGTDDAFIDVDIYYTGTA
jgi:hypothetical protein